MNMLIAKRLLNISVRNKCSLIVASHNNKEYSSQLSRIYTAARKLNNPIKCVVCGSNTKNIATKISQNFDLASVVYIESDKLANKLPEYHCDALAQYLASDPDISHILFNSESFSKSTMPRLAAKFLSAPLTDVIDVISEDTFIRSIYAGNIQATVQMLDKMKFMTILATSFENASNSRGFNSPINEFKYSVKSKAQSEMVEEKLNKSDLPDLSSAKIILSGGRGLKSKENFDKLYNLARKMKAGVGASRAVVDAGMVSNDLQIGQTGKIVAPELYVAFGISGAIQHVAGIKDSKVIVAINKDSEAPIFQIADIGLVEDAEKVVDEMASRIK